MTEFNKDVHTVQYFDELAEKRHNNVTAMAKELGISRTTFRRWRAKITNGSNPSEEYNIATYIQMMEFCKKHPELSLTAGMYKKCEIDDRKHWRSAVQHTIDILRTMKEFKQNPNIS